MIKIDSLSFTYPDREFHLDIPQLTVASGERVAVIGPSGSGKTTLLNLVAGILIPGSGVVSVSGQHVSGMSDGDRRRFRITRIGFVFQSFELLEYLNVIDNILHPYRISSALRLTRAVRERAAVLADSMGIGDKLRRPVTNLSQGEKQRVAICRALLPGPSLVLADEATGNLDPDNKEQILELLFRQVADHQATLLAVTHDHDLLPQFDRVVDFQAFRGTPA
ncbi:MAG: ABC transporter ATP-binding protein [Gammaproteobacteria bacterium]|nr:MAG: ABC transporter ATP-binding protein [Gammaproteobacteria bacterium]